MERAPLHVSETRLPSSDAIDFFISDDAPRLINVLRVAEYPRVIVLGNSWCLHDVGVTLRKAAGAKEGEVGSWSKERAAASTTKRQNSCYLTYPSNHDIFYYLHPRACASLHRFSATHCQYLQYLPIAGTHHQHHRLPSAMEAPALPVPEHSPAPSSQSRRPHQVLSRVNLRRKDHESTQSLSKKFSSSSATAHDRKGSVDSVASAPLKPDIGPQSLDGCFTPEDDAVGSKLSKLIPGHKKRQRRKILEQQLAAQAEGEEQFRGRSARPLNAGLRGVHLGIGSSESINDDDESLLTNDSDVES